MSADPKNPKPGDVFVNNVGSKVTITAVGDQRALGRINDGTHELAFDLANIAKWLPAPARPTVAEQWGVIDAWGAFQHAISEKRARSRADWNGDDTLACICHTIIPDGSLNPPLWAVVCDERGTPIPIQVAQ